MILIGPAVADTAGGKDPYEGFIVRMGLFIGVAIYAWLAIVFLEWFRTRRRLVDAWHSAEVSPALATEGTT